jgi:hypothetical protein
VRTIRGDSLDDIEPFCMDQEAAPARLPGIQEARQGAEERSSAGVSSVKVNIISADDKETRLSLSKDMPKDGDRDYSVHSSPDEVEEKICTDTESGIFEVNSMFN